MAVRAEVMRSVRAGSAALLALAGLACASGPAPVSRALPRFDFARDTFFYPNDLVWHYEKTAKMKRLRPDRDAAGPAQAAPARFVQRCPSMVRSARQFYFGARFDPSATPASPARYRELIARVLDSDPRIQGPTPDPVVIPGYADLRSLSRDYSEVILEALGGRWWSYLQRGNWRMIYPFSAAQQQRTAQRFRASVARSRPVAARLVRFPAVEINHTVLVFDFIESETEIRFLVYDPNDADEPLSLVYERAARRFLFPPTAYWSGGAVKVYEIYDGAFF